jgi:hypothetical protein
MAMERRTARAAFWVGGAKADVTPALARKEATTAVEENFIFVY